MARHKKQTKAKEPVRIRFKDLSNGNKSIYLDIYKDGKRSYEFLKLYLVPEKTQSAKIQNEQVLASANAIKSQRIIELSNGAAGINNGGKSKIIFHDWLQIYYEQKRKKVSQGSARLVEVLLKHLEAYGDKIPMRQIDKNYCVGFAQFLIDYVSRKGNQRLKPFTITVRYKLFMTALNAAVRDGIIETNPANKIKHSDILPKCESVRGFLTIEEVRQLIKAPAQNKNIKQAFLFSCFCGLRWSDIKNLTWGNIEENNGRSYVNITMQKTKEKLYLPLSTQALNYLPVRENGAKSNDLVFKDMGSNAMANYYLKLWCAAAGITKNVSFHMARHTFATTSLTLGADLFTTSKLLGHTNIATTQIYAKIINEKKNEAVDLFDAAF